MGRVLADNFVDRAEKFKLPRMAEAKMMQRGSNNKYSGNFLKHVS